MEHVGKKICPLSTVMDGVYCCTDQCAWWDENNNQCSAKTVATTLNDILTIFDSITNIQGSSINIRSI